MAKGRTYQHERVLPADPSADQWVVQLTSFPTTSMNLPYWYRSPNNGFTHDGRSIVFRAMRCGDRNAPWDLFRVDTDGTNLVQLTERERLGGVALSGTRGVAYLFDRGTAWTVDLETFEEREFGHVETGLPDWGGTVLPGHEHPNGTVTPDDQWYFTPVLDTDGQQRVARFATDGSVSDLLPLGSEWKIQSAAPDGRGLVMNHHDGDDVDRMKLVSVGGEEIATFGRNIFAHSSPLGRTGRHQGCAHLPDRRLIVMAEGQEFGETLVEGPYFWHSSASLDGEWIVADTNWPNEGIQLVNVRTRRFATLVHPRNSAGYPQWTHAHPFFNPDMKHVAFNSDVSGTGQVWITNVPEELTDSLAR